MNLINDLLLAGIINADDARLLNTNFIAQLTGSKLLYTLHSNLLDKAIPNRDKGGYTLTLYDKNIEPKAASGEANKLLDVLLSHDIISLLVWQKLQGLAIPNTTSGAIAALHMAGELMAYEENFTIQNQLAFANLLLG